jgi:hypothetical protein
MKSLRSLLALLLSGALVTAAAWQGAATGPPAELIPVLQNQTPRYWKGNLHTHSFWSDGDDFPEMIADWYKTRGYQFLMLSDHNVLSEGERWVDVAKRETAVAKYEKRFGEPWLERRVDKDGRDQVRLKPLAEFRPLLEEPGRFLLIPGEEITGSFAIGKAKLPVHINAVNVRDLLPPAVGDSVSESIRANLRAVAEQRKRTGWRTIAFLNHPNFGWGVKGEDLFHEELRFFEVFNGHPGVRNYGDATHPGTEKLWDIALALRLGRHKLPIVYGLATDDAHNYHAVDGKKSNPGRAWVMVRTPHLSPESLVRALEAGDFYGSSGVRLRDVRCDGKRLTLAIEPEAGVTYRTQFVATLRDAPLDSQPRKDAEGKPLDVTRIYSDEIGKVVAESKDLEPTYALTGQELYVRARVISTKQHPNPFQAGDVEMAWTQPVLP